VGGPGPRCPRRAADLGIARTCLRHLRAGIRSALPRGVSLRQGRASAPFPRARSRAVGLADCSGRLRPRDRRPGRRLVRPRPRLGRQHPAQHRLPGDAAAGHVRQRGRVDRARYRTVPWPIHPETHRLAAHADVPLDARRSYRAGSQQPRVAAPHDRLGRDRLAALAGRRSRSGISSCSGCRTWGAAGSGRCGSSSASRSVGC